MSAEELRRRMTATPFKLFTVNVADGRRIPVVGRDFILISDSGRVVTVIQRDDSFDVLDCLLITGLSFGPPQPAAPDATS